MDTKKFIKLIQASEEKLINEVLRYAIERDYAKYTSTLKEAWRMSIQGLSNSLVKVLEKNDKVPEMNPDIDFSKSEIAEFGIVEANLHRSRGITLSMFLSFMKYYQQAYQDVLSDSDFSVAEKEFFSRYLKRYFDFVEIGFIVVWSDLSEEKKLEELQSKNREIENEKNEYLTVFESMYDPVILFHNGNTIQNFNNKAAEIFLNIHESGKKYYSRVKTGEELKEIIEQIKDELNENKDEKIFEKEISTLTGNRNFVVKLKKLMDVSEKYMGTIAIFSDITERIKLLEEKAKMEQSLLQHQRLQSIGTLASGVAHEINNPVNGIMNYSQLIKDEGGIPAAVKEYADEILAESNRVAFIVKDLLDFARGNSFGTEKADICEIIKHTTSLIETVLKQDSIRLICDKPASLPKIECNVQQIKQVIMNLLNNARDALNAKYEDYDENKVIQASCSSEEINNKTWIRLQIKDKGIGIKEEIIDQIYDPFFTTKSRAEGTGLGLSICYKIIEKHKGTISVESKENEFTRFTILLPCEKSDETKKNAI